MGTVKIKKVLLEKNKKKICSRCKKHRRYNEHSWCWECNKQRNREFNWNLRLRIIRAYGGRCKCCDETEPKFLTLDHKDGKGKEHRQKAGGDSNFYRWLKQNNFPKRNLQLLCYNCNCSKGVWGICPHNIK